MIRYLDNREKGLTKELWREAFPEDSEDFLDYYDHEKMKENQVLVREEADKIQSMLHLNPYHLQVRNAEWDIDYIVGDQSRYAPSGLYAQPAASDDGRYAEETAAVLFSDAGGRSYLYTISVCFCL